MQLRLIDIKNVEYIASENEEPGVLSMEVNYLFKSMFWNVEVKYSLSLDELVDYHSMRNIMKNMACLVLSNRLVDGEKFNLIPNYPTEEGDNFDIEKQLSKKQGNYIIKFTELMENEPDRDDWWDVITEEEFEQRAEAAKGERVIISEAQKYIHYPENKKKLNVFDVYLDNIKSEAKRNKAKKEILKAINTVGKR